MVTSACHWRFVLCAFLASLFFMHPSCGRGGVPLPSVSIATLKTYAFETSSVPAIIRISRSGGTASSLDVYFSTGGWAAVNGQDYDLTSPAQIPAGQSYVDLAITPMDDTEYELTQDVIVSLLPNPSYTISGPRDAVIFIYDNEQPGTELIAGVDDATSVTDTSARIHGAVLVTFHPITYRVIAYGKGEDPYLWTDWITTPTVNGDDFYIDLTGLTPGQTYHFWAGIYCDGAAAVQYSEVGRFRTTGGQLKIDQDELIVTDIRSTTDGVGWSNLGEGRFPPSTGSETDTSYWESADGGELRAAVTAYTGVPAHMRVTGFKSEKEAWLPFSSVGTGNYVRAKFYVFRGFLWDPSDLNTVPNVRFRVAARFAQTSLLEVLHQQTRDDPANTVSGDLIPGTPYFFSMRSIYRVDFAPVYVPALDIPGEGVMVGYEAYSLDPEDYGSIVLNECIVGTYPKSALSNTVSPLKIYVPSPSDSGDFEPDKPSNTKTDSLILSTVEGEFATVDTTQKSQVTDDNSGVTFETSGISKQAGSSFRVGIASREFFAGSNPAQRVRVEAGKLYKVAYHLTSTQQSNRMPMVRPRVHTVKFGYTQKFEIGGALNTGGGNQADGNNLIALQSLPGIGTLNPDKIGSENGGWYTLIVNTPIDPQMNQLNSTQPLINAQPGPGSAGTSLRDLKCAFDLIDSMDTSPAALEWERGSVKLDRIEIRRYNQIPD